MYDPGYDIKRLYNMMSSKIVLGRRICCTNAVSAVYIVGAVYKLTERNQKVRYPYETDRTTNAFNIVWGSSDWHQSI
jgi:hypothetical protein